MLNCCANTHILFFQSYFFNIQGWIVILGKLFCVLLEILYSILSWVLLLGMVTAYSHLDLSTRTLNCLWIPGSFLENFMSFTFSLPREFTITDSIPAGPAYALLCLTFLSFLIFYLHKFPDSQPLIRSHIQITSLPGENFKGQFAGPNWFWFCSKDEWQIEKSTFLSLSS